MALREDYPARIESSEVPPCLGDDGNGQAAISYCRTQSCNLRRTVADNTVEGIDRHLLMNQRLCLVAFESAQIVRVAFEVPRPETLPVKVGQLRQAGRKHGCLEVCVSIREDERDAPLHKAVQRPNKNGDF